MEITKAVFAEGTGVGVDIFCSFISIQRKHPFLRERKPGCELLVRA